MPKPNLPPAQEESPAAKARLGAAVLGALPIEPQEAIHAVADTTDELSGADHDKDYAGDAKTFSGAHNVTRSLVLPSIYRADSSVAARAKFLADNRAFLSPKTLRARSPLKVLPRPEEIGAIRRSGNRKPKAS